MLAGSVVSLGDCLLDLLCAVGVVILLTVRALARVISNSSKHKQTIPDADYKALTYSLVIFWPVPFIIKNLAQKQVKCTFTIHPTLLEGPYNAVCNMLLTVVMGN